MIFDFQFMADSFFELLKILPFTLFITITPLFFGLFIGTVVALIGLYKIKGFYRLSEFYVSFLRGTPLMLHIFIIYYGFPKLFDWIATRLGWEMASNLIPTAIFTIIAFSITSGAYLSETIRAGILGVNKGEVEAGYSIGMTTIQALKRIVLPQAVSLSLPNLCNTFVNIFHGTSLAFYISLIELTGKATILASHNSRYLETYLAAGLIYWLVSIAVELTASRFENRLKLSSQGA